MRGPGTTMKFEGRSRLIYLMLVATTATGLATNRAYDWHQPKNACNRPGRNPSVMIDVDPTFPRLPDRYSMKVEANILQKQWTTEVEEHYDKAGHMASRRMTFNGTTILTLFDLQSGERFTIQPDGSCKTEVIENDAGSSRMDMANRLAINMFNEDLHQGAHFIKIYMGREYVRGIPVNHWTECETWPELQAQFQVDYYFSDPDYITAGGVSQIPVRVVMNGTAHNVDITHESLPGSHQFYHIYDFTDFRTGPPDDRNIFRIPIGVVCKDRRNKKPMPILPKCFEVDVEILIAGTVPYPVQERLVYNLEFNILETQRTGIYPIYNHDTNTTLFTSYAITTVEDFNTQAIFINNERNSSCTVHVMGDKLNTAMSHGLNLFHVALNSPLYEYQGKKEVRGLLVDAWGLEHKGITMEMYFLIDEAEDVSTINQEQSTNVWATPVGMLLRNSSGTNESELPLIWEELLSSNLDGEQRHTGNSEAQRQQTPADDLIVWGLQIFDSRIREKFVHFTHYSPVYNSAINFDIDQCFSQQEKDYIFIKVNASEYDLYQNESQNQHGKTIDIIYSMKKAMVQSVPGIRYLQLKYVGGFDYFQDTSTYFFFNILGMIPEVQLMTGRLKSLQELKEILHEAVQQGIYFQTQYGSKRYIIDTAEANVDWSEASIFLADKKALTSKPINQSMYSPQAVAGISLAMLVLGACLCFFIVVILYRRRHPGQGFMFYKMTD